MTENDPGVASERISYNILGGPGECYEAGTLRDVQCDCR